MKTVNELDYLYRKLLVKAQEKRNNTVEITDEEYAKCYEVEPEPIESIPDEEEPDLTININANNNELIPELSRLEFPKVKDNGNNMIVIHRTSDGEINYSLEWDCDKKTSRWVCFQWDESNSGGYIKIEDNFVEDPDIPIEARFTNTYEMYSGSDFGRGPLIASADRWNSLEANRQTFYYSNMQPQYYEFNGGIWSNLEMKIRSWNTNAFRNTLYVVKGGTIDNEDQILTRIKPDVEGGLIVPKYFFVAVLCKNMSQTNGGYKAIGFWIEHRNDYEDETNLVPYIVSIKQLEELTGLEFFCNLPDVIESAVKEQVNLAAWGFSN